jgi:tripartite-type tricarboxylate transporter receptor subunit TctC
MTESEAVVTRVEGEFAFIEVKEGAAACGSCGGKSQCGKSQTGPRRYAVRNVVGAAPGDTIVVSVPDARNALQQNKGVRAIAVTSPERTDMMKGVPAMAESLPGYVVMQHFGLLSPAGTPADVVRKLAEATATALAEPEVREKFTSLGMLPVSSTPEELGKVIADDREHWGPIIAKLPRK